ncbi:hypothetical protein HanXRQr2_Chr09g0386491 [Helianthus annuus]|uniref:Uncharacterized protein n=1 Tax=Helianthus annuus TaxID=4232 RepID=A0A9K3I6D7_HELAN|nr:hypothetical protein HanXRQr2_Chr09g0386491 [Helianthus annuus]
MRISSAALEVVSNTLEDALTSNNVMQPRSQRCRNGFQDCSERSATTVFLDNCSDAAISTNAFSYLPCKSCKA